MERNQRISFLRLLALCGALACFVPFTHAQALSIAVNTHGQYSIGQPAVLTAQVAAEVDGKWLRAADYPQCETKQSSAQGYLGAATQSNVTCSGLDAAPNLSYQIRAYSDQPFADIQASVQNTTNKTIHVQAIRVVDAAGDNIANLNGPAAQDRVLSDSFSEDRPAMQLHDLGDAEDKMHRAVGASSSTTARAGKAFSSARLPQTNFSPSCAFTPTARRTSPRTRSNPPAPPSLRKTIPSSNPLQKIKSSSASP